MRNYTLLLPIILLFAACAGEQMDIDTAIASGDLEQIRALRAELKGQEMDLAAQLTTLDEAIAKLDKHEKMPLITTTTVESQDFEHFIELQGNVQTEENLELYPEFAGTLTQVLVDEGQRVSKGQVLARIDDGGLSQQRGQLQIQLDLAQTTYERQSRLWQQKIGSEMQYLQAKTSYEAQQESLAQIDRQLAKTTIRAPFSGTIDEIITEQGAVVNPGMSPIMRIVGSKDMYVEIDVPEVHLPSLKTKAHAVVEIPVLAKTYDSMIKSIGSYINPANRTFKVEIPLKEKDGLIRPNLNTRVKINDYSKEAAILIPQSVISEDAEGNNYVYVVVDIESNKGMAKKTYISTGLTQGDLIEVLEGLNESDALVIEGARAIRDGQRVEILKS